MTENEAIEILRNNFPKTCKMVDGKYKGGFDDVECEFGKALLLAISALEEIQQYRAIGTVEECREARERQRAEKPEWSPDCEECEKYETLYCTYKCGSYSTLSSVLVCPNCKKQRVIKEHGHRYCYNCGQSIDWSDA